MKVFLCEQLHPEALALLQSRAEVVADRARVAECDALITRNIPVTAELMRGMPRLRAVGIHGTGCDAVDLGFCEQQGIKAVYTPHYNANAVAELNAALALMLCRGIHTADRALQSGTPMENTPLSLMGQELRGKTLGLVGTGAIARRTAEILQQGFGMKAVGWSPNFTKQRAAECGIAFAASLQDVLRQADVLCICCPRNERTLGMISDAELALMKPSAYLINTARGGIAEEAALCRALQTGVIAGAACDVFVSEPPTKQNPLTQLPNFIATPHLGGNTEDALRTIGMKLVTQLFAALDGEALQHDAVKDWRQKQ